MPERKYIEATRGQMSADPWGRPRPAQRIRGVLPVPAIERLKADGWQVTEERPTPAADLEQRFDSLLDELAGRAVIGHEMADQLRGRPRQKQE